jgi:hypothetical protein
MLQFSLSPDTEEALRRRADAIGQEATALAARLIQDALSAPSVDELLAPFRRQVEESGITDEDLDRLGEELQGEVRQERQSRSAGAV